MTYQDYFKQTNFEDIWAILSGFYGEHDALKLERKGCRVAPARHQTLLFGGKLIKGNIANVTVVKFIVISPIRKVSQEASKVLAECC